MNEIFLSYKRSDDPGYVARLADSLQRTFGEDTVYRDVESNLAGGNWKKTITRTVSGAEVVLAVIGPEWQKLIAGRPSDELDWVRFELNQALNLDVPVIPVRLAHTVFDHNLDLKDLAWLTDLQFFELADGQGRWESDMTRLTAEIAKVSSLEITDNPKEKASSISQETQGDQSPVIVGDGATITYGKS